MDIYFYADEPENERNHLLLIGKGTAQLDPLESEAQGKNVYLMPPTATKVAPPKGGEGYVTRWNPTANKWDKLLNVWGESYYNGEDAVEIKFYGDPADKGYTKEPVYTLATVKERKMKEISREHEQELKNKDGGVLVEGIGVINAGRDHLQNIDSFLSILPDGGTMPFRLYDNTMAQVTKEQLISARAAMVLAAQEIYAHKWALEGLIALATDKADVKALDWKLTPAPTSLLSEVKKAAQIVKNNYISEGKKEAEVKKLMADYVKDTGYPLGVVFAEYAEPKTEQETK